MNGCGDPTFGRSDLRQSDRPAIEKKIRTIQPRTVPVMHSQPGVMEHTGFLFHTRGGGDGLVIARFVARKCIFHVIPC